jgi:hypothetical protein
VQLAIALPSCLSLRLDLSEPILSEVLVDVSVALISLQILSLDQSLHMSAHFLSSPQTRTATDRGTGRGVAVRGATDKRGEGRTDLDVWTEERELREDLSDELLMRESLPRLHDADNGSFDGVATILLKLLGIVRLVHHSDGDAESQTLGAREQRRGEREFRERERRWEGKGTGEREKSWPEFLVAGKDIRALDWVGRRVFFEDLDLATGEGMHDSLESLIRELVHGHQVLVGKHHRSGGSRGRGTEGEEDSSLESGNLDLIGSGGIDGFDGRLSLREDPLELTFGGFGFVEIIEHLNPGGGGRVQHSTAQQRRQEKRVRSGERTETRKGREGRGGVTLVHWFMTGGRMTS